MDCQDVENKVKYILSILREYRFLDTVKPPGLCIKCPLFPIPKIQIEPLIRLVIIAREKKKQMNYKIRVGDENL